MSGSFTFSVNADPFVPKGFDGAMDQQGVLQTKIDSLQAELENEKITNMKLMKLYKDQCSKVQENSEERLKSLTSKNERLNREIRSVNTSLLEERCDKRELGEKVQTMQARINNLNTDLGYKDDQYNTLHRRFNELNREFTRYRDRGDPEIWMGRCLKLDFIFKKMQQIGALPEDHGAWVWDMVEDIEFPDNQSVSVFLSLPSSIRNRYLPSFDDAGINFQSGEDSIINELSREAEEFNSRLTENFRRNLDENPQLVLNSIRNIQARFREYIRPNLEKRIKAAIKIQSVWRGFCGRGITTYKGDLFEFVNECKISLDREIILPTISRVLPTRICLSNTSDQTIYYQWIKVNNKELEGTKGRMYTVHSGETIRVKVFHGHWFRIYKEGNEKNTFFRINPTSFLGSLRTQGSTSHPAVFDLNTKITLSYSDYSQWRNYNSSGILNTRHLITGRAEVNRVNNHPLLEEDDDDDNARLMLAIQLSLDYAFPPLTRDAIDFNIGNLFSDI